MLSSAKPSKCKLDAYRLRQLLSYDESTGLFLKNGRPVGRPRKDGYVIVCIDRVAYYGHRLAWMHVYGDWPEGVIDHIDGNPSNNRLGNLRDVSKGINSQNMRRAMTNNKSGQLGVVWGLLSAASTTHQ